MEPINQVDTRWRGPSCPLALALALLFTGGWCLAPARGQTINGNVTWSDDQYDVEGTLVIANDGVLTIEPGVRVAMGPGAIIDVEGELRALGTEEDPIRFDRLEASMAWGHIEADGAVGPLRLEHCIVEGGMGVDWGWLDLGMIGVRNGTLVLIGTEVAHGTDCAVLGVGSSIEIRDCSIHQFYDVGVSLRPGCSGVVASSVFYSFTDDGLNVDGSVIDILDSEFYGANDDGIDFDGSIGSIRNNTIHDCGQNGITCAGDTDQVWIENCLIRDCLRGFEVKQSAIVTAYNCTLVNNTIGVRLYENGPGNGGGNLLLRNSILWGNSTVISIDEESYLSVLFSNVQGDSVQPGIGNINTDPQFLNPPAGNFGLKALSPCVDAAMSTQAPDTDIQGQERYDSPFVPNTGSGTEPYYDMGCDEYNPETSGAPATPAVAGRLLLQAPYPNPFHQRTTARLDLPRPSMVAARVVGLDGRRVRTLGEGLYPRGVVTWAWDGVNDAGRPVASGGYVLVIETEGGATLSRRLVFLR
jgi:hypothetical protein